MLGIVFSCALLLSLFITSRLIRPRTSKNPPSLIGLDIPNERSMHSIPTPRGGGIAILVSSLVIPLFFATLFSSISKENLIFFAGAAALGLLGWFDDKYSIRAALKLGVQGVVVATTVYLLLSAHFSPLPLFIITFLWVWGVNLTNFMDGIDGIATSQAIFVLSSFLILYGNEISTPEAYFLSAFLGACFGFLKYNWPKAKIFMGDVGSLLLGYVLFGVAWAPTRLSSDLWERATVLFILNGAFFIDATFTVIVRISSKQNPFRAHRDHAYQKAVLKGLSPRKVVLGALGLNLFWIFPWAWAVRVNFFAIHPLFIWAFSTLPVFLLCKKFGAGSPHNS